MHYTKRDQYGCGLFGSIAAIIVAVIYALCGEPGFLIYLLLIFGIPILLILLVDIFKKTEQKVNYQFHNISPEIQKILEMHIVFQKNNLPIHFKSSIHNQYKSIYNRNYILQKSLTKEDLAKIKVLNLRTSKEIKDLAILKYMSKIEKLQIFSEEKFIYNIEEIGNLQSLTQLLLFTSNIKDYSFIKRNPNLKDLLLTNSEIENYNFLVYLKGLEKLTFSPLMLKKDDHLFELCNLQELSIGNCSVVDTSAIIKLLKLKVFKAHSFELQNIDFLKQMNIQELLIRKGNLNSDEIEWLKNNISNLILLK